MNSETPLVADPTQIPSTAGMTTRVFKGSLWLMAAHILPMAVSLVTTPFVIRMLGSEPYGVLILIGLIPTYLGFADFGMNLASTRFASEAYATGSRDQEARIVRTAALIAVFSSLPFAIGIFIFSDAIAIAFNVPEYLLEETSLSLKFAAGTFVINFLSAILNTPQLTRLRMDLTSIANTVPKVLMTAAIPFVLYLGGGILGAVILVFVASIVILIWQLIFSARLLPQIIGLGIDRNMFRPLLKFGGGLLIAMLAGLLLVNLEKILLTRLVSVESLAYYSIAFTLSTMTSMFSLAMIQALIPAFSQLLGDDKRSEFHALFLRGIRVNLLWLLPTVMTLFVIAKPFFTVWAGEAFGRESTAAFHILLVGLIFNIVAYVPHGAITAAGRTDLFAKLYWIELVLYAGVAVVLISRFQIVGAAAAWALRVTIDAVAIIWLSKRVIGVSFDFTDYFRRVVAASLILAPPILFAEFYDNFSLWLAVLVPCSLLAYLVFVWRTLLSEDEKTWLANKVTAGAR